MANCSREFKAAIGSLAVKRQEGEVDPSWEGQKVWRDGEVHDVYGVNFSNRWIGVVGTDGRKRQVPFDKFLSSRVVVLKEDVELLPVEAGLVTSALAGRVLIGGDGQRWKVTRVSKQPGSEARLVTLKSEDGKIDIMSAEELEAAGFRYRKPAKQTVTQRLAGVYKESVAREG